MDSNRMNLGTRMSWDEVAGCWVRSDHGLIDLQTVSLES